MEIPEGRDPGVVTRPLALPGAAASAAGRTGARVRLAAALGLALPLAMAVFLRFYRLAETGQNLYYAAAVRSMLDSWRNFFFVSFDPGGRLMVDKPPLGLWLQTGVAKLLSFDYWTLALPQALAGSFAVAMVFALVRKRYGTLCATVAASALAVAPVSVASARNNSFDTLTMFLVLAAAAALIRAREARRSRWLVLCATMLGLGFNAKMGAALVPLPAFALYYVYGNPLAFRALVARGALFGSVLLVVALAWIVPVAATPAASRPTIYNGQGNNIWALTVEYNGAWRVFGGKPPPGLRGEGPPPGSAADLLTVAAGTPAPGPQRLLSGRLGRQLGWFFPFAVVGLAGSLHSADRRARPTALLWTSWFVLAFVLFSAAAIVVPQYLESMAAPAVILFAVGFTTVHRWLRARERRAFVTLAANAAFATILAAAAGPPLAVFVPAAVAVAALVAALASLSAASGWRLAAPVALAALFVSALAGPAAWSFATAAQAATGSATRYPAGDPGSLRNYPAAPGGDAPRPASIAADPVLGYLLANAPPGGILVAGERALSGDAARYILLSNRPLLTLDAYQGDEVAAAADLERLVAADRLRFLELPPSGPWTGAGPLGRWFLAHCTDITGPGLRPLDGYSRLYRCRP